MAVDEEDVEEFREIAREILKREITMQEVRELAFKWARNKLEIRRKHGFYVDEGELERMAEEHVGKILELRARLGLENPEQHSASV